jgi:hypothetical protein
MLYIYGEVRHLENKRKPIFSIRLGQMRHGGKKVVSVNV